MEIARKVGRTREQCRKYRKAGESIALVPTMGALHEGHLSLIRKGRDVADRVAVSIFVNPLQFGPGEDLERYPRPLAQDVETCDREGVDLVFHPGEEELYPEGFSTFVEVEGLGDRMCGKTRPGHFRGVATVVMKLFQIFQPDFGVLGQKDAQQAVIVRRMARDLDVPIEIVVCPIVREVDGLAVSSRNRYLSREERLAATVLYRALCRAESLVGEGERSSRKIEEEMREILESEPLAKTEYVSITGTEDLKRVKRLKGKTLIALAAQVGSTRLIDNLVVEV